MRFRAKVLLVAALSTLLSMSASSGEEMSPARPAEVIYAKVKQIRSRDDYHGALISVDPQPKWVIEAEEVGVAPGEPGEALAFGIHDIENRFGAKAEVLIGRTFVFTGLPLGENKGWLWTIKPGPNLLTGEWEAATFERKDSPRVLSQENLLALAAQLKQGLTQEEVRALTATVAPKVEWVGIGTASEMGLGTHEVMPSSDGSGVSLRMLYDHRLRLVTWNLCHPMEKEVKEWITDNVGVLKGADYAARVKSIVRLAEFKGEALKLEKDPQWVVTFEPYAEFRGIMPERLSAALADPEAILGRGIEEAIGVPCKVISTTYWHRGTKKRLHEIEVTFPVPDIPGHPQMIMTQEDVKWIADRIKQGMTQAEINHLRSMTGKSGFMRGRGGRNIPSTLEIKADDGSGFVLEMVMKENKVDHWEIKTALPKDADSKASLKTNTPGE
ncbi:MAG: hypothetical protein M5U26_29995 [Planctomycetota bacterium]|nr:hypothetical protein [Planctomycetota bacterium]